MNVWRWISLAGTAAVLVLIGVLIAQRMEKVGIQRAEQAKPVIVPPPAVETAKVVTHDFVTTIDVTGEVRARRVVQVFPKVGGRVEELAVGLSDSVTQNQVLARVEENDLGFRERQGEAGARAASAQVRAAAVQAENARIELARAEELFKAQALPEADLIRIRGMKNAADAALSAAKAQVDVARAGSDLAKEARSWTAVLSPIDGVVTRKLTQLGAQAGTQQPMFEIQDQSALEILVDVPAAALDALSVGKAVKFRVDERPGKTFEATVKAIGKSLDPMTRRVRVELEAPGAVVAEGVLPAMIATVAIEIDRDMGLRAVPRQAVVTLAQGPSVFVVRGGKAVRLVPDLDHMDEEHVAVPDAKPDDEVVIEGQALLGEGVEVKAVGKAAAPATPAPEGDKGDKGTKAAAPAGGAEKAVAP